MLKEFIHILRTYLITFRYLKKIDIRYIVLTINLSVLIYVILAII